MTRPIAFHPILIALCPVLFTYAHNLEQVAFSETLLPAAVCVGVALLLWLLAWPIYRNWLNSAVVVSLSLFVFFFHGHFVDALLQQGLWLRTRYMLLIWLGLLLACAYVVKRRSRPLVRLTEAFNVAAVCLVAMAIAAIAVGRPSLGGARHVSVADAVASPAGKGRPRAEDLPDIYYIILDQYPRADILREQYDHDNSEFLDHLRSKGFYVASQSYANYPRTWVSLASSLNMEHLHHLMEQGGSSGITRRIVFPRIRDHLVGRYLKEIGYRYVHMGSWWNPTMRSPLADENVNLYALPEFAGVVYSQTILSPILWHFGAYDVRRAQWERVRHKLAVLATIPDMPGPVFTFAHFLLPHRPYVFRSDGSFLTLGSARKLSRQASIRGQVQFINTALRKLIDRLLSASHPAPIIILQADEGPYPDAPPDFLRATPRQLQEKMAILNALHLPGFPMDKLYPSITPVNTFRSVFDHYFGADLPPLPDECYVPAMDKGRRVLVRVTDRLASPPADADKQAPREARPPGQ